MRPARWSVCTCRVAGITSALLSVAMPATAEVSIAVQFDGSDDAGASVPLILDAAASAWEHCLRQLPKALEIVVSTSFAELPCGGGKRVAARAHGGAGLERGGLLLSLPLAAYSEGYALGIESGLGIELNSTLLAPNACDGAQWSMALPGDESSSVNGEPELFAAMQHELGHLLGLDVGYHALESSNEQPSVYLTRLASRMHGAALSELTLEQLQKAATTPGNVVWTGAHTRALAASQLESGVPEMFVQSVAPPSDLTGELLGYGARLLSKGSLGNVPLSGRLTRVDDACGAATDRSGQVALVRQPTCGTIAAATNLLRDGAAAIIIESEEVLPPQIALPIPVVASSGSRLSNIIADVGSVDVLLRKNDRRLSGADASGNVYVHTPEEFDPAVSLVHLDPATVAAAHVAYPTSNVPELGHGADPTCGFAFSMLLDLGYAKPACGDGSLGPDEACDDGVVNSDIRPNACRLSCQLPSCGDGVVDDGEACDDGALNGSGSDACRPGCIEPRCGDGVVDIAHGERCDEGAANSDSGHSPCRVSCLPATCGDGVVDEGEACDDGVRNSNMDPDRCRVDCSSPRCGDGVVDTVRGETCDDGNTVADPWCDEDCKALGESVPVVDAATVDAASSHGLDAGVSTFLPDANATDVIGEPDAASLPGEAESRTTACQCALGTQPHQIGSSSKAWPLTVLGAVCLRRRRQRSARQLSRTAAKFDLRDRALARTSRARLSGP